MKWYLKVLQNYASFNGRARRSEYWYFVLFNLLFTIFAMILDRLLGLTFTSQTGMPFVFGYIYLLYNLIVFIPSVAVAVRRLHDIGKSGWRFFIVLIPLIGGLVLLADFIKDSQPGENKYGPNPSELPQ